MRPLVAALLFFTWTLNAQYDQQARNAFIQNDIRQGFDFWNISKPTTTFHSAFQPYLSSTFSNATDSGLPFRTYPFKNLFLSRTYNEKPQKRNWFNLQFHPLAELEFGYDRLLGKPLASAAGGMHVKLNINDDFTFAGTVIGGSYQYPFFLDTTNRKNRLLPEFGQAYKNKNNNGYNFFDWQGYVSYSPNNNRVFNFQAGRDKHFIGDGYRSLLLSDFAPAYPFFRINTNIWRIQYNVWYSWMYDVSNSMQVKNNFTNKYGAFHYLSYNVTRSFNIGIFENVVWKGTDSNQVRNFDVNYLNPVIFFRPVEYSIGSSDNSFLGLNLNATLFKRLKVYGQIALDEFYLRELRARRGWWGNKQGVQVGGKWINALGVKGLELQGEYNQVRPYTYSHGAPEQNYAHYGMPLAHPLGANFKEALGFITYRKGRGGFSTQLMIARSGRDSSAASNVGQNIFLSYTTRPFEYGHYTTQGVLTKINQVHFRFFYQLVPELNLRLELGYIQRSEKNDRQYELQNPYFYVGIRSTIWNNYRDY